jgi:tripartite ATP-independent transporter DctM subunit
MAQFGLLLLALVALLVCTTGLPVFAVLLMASTLGALVGIAAGAFPVALLGALPARLIGLLEHDLLQAVPLFVLVGALLDRLPLADLLYRCGCRLAGRGPASPHVAALGLSALLAPMNGSVGASVAMLSRVVAPRLQAQGVDAAHTTALVSVASTLGVLVPPSIVLLLLGDTMMRAHTEAQLLSGADARILNTQDLLRGVLPAAGVVLVLCMLVTWWQARRAPAPRASTVPSLTAWEVALAFLCVAVLLALLGGVALGWFYAVEAAATGGVLLLVGAAVSGQLSRERLNAALFDALDVTGSLFALFAAATTFTLLLRALGTDAWVHALVARLPGGSAGTVVSALGALLLCGLVLDAFELIFVVVPILMPPVLARVDDALWVAVLSLLTLQMSFLLPPLGYATMMSSARITPHPHTRTLLATLMPTLVALAGVLALVLLQPRIVHLLDATPIATAPRLSPEEVERVLRGGE